SSTTTLNGLGGDDTFNVTAMNGPVNVNGGDGNDTVNVGSAAPSHPDLPTTKVGNVDSINGLLTVNGGARHYVMKRHHSRTPDEAKTGTLTNSTIRDLKLENGIDYSSLEALSIWLAPGNNTFDIKSTHAGTTTVNTAAGDDTVNINDATGILIVNAEAGDDII